MRHFVANPLIRIMLKARAPPAPLRAHGGLVDQERRLNVGAGP